MDSTLKRRGNGLFNVESTWCVCRDSFSETERYVTVLSDGKKIQEDLVWDKHSGELIEFVDLGDIYTNYDTLKSVEKLTSHA